MAATTDAGDGEPKRLSLCEAAEALTDHSGTLTNIEIHGQDEDDEQDAYDDDDFAKLGEALATNTTLTSLALGQIEIGDDGAARLGEALATNTTLTSLDLMKYAQIEIGIGAEGAARLGEALHTNSTLTYLSLRYNFSCFMPWTRARRGCPRRWPSTPRSPRST